MLQEAGFESVHATEDDEICSPERDIRLTLDNVDVLKPQCSNFQIIRNTFFLSIFLQHFLGSPLYGKKLL